MLIEQIIEFELRGPGTPGSTCTQTTGYCYDKTKICKADLRVDYYLLLVVILLLICIILLFFKRSTVAF